jgi:mRNA interferase RelE/StbE
LVYKISFKSSVERDLKKIDKTQAKIIITKIETEPAERADQFPALTGKFAGLQKYRVGDYRIIYTIIDDSVLILRVSHRKDAYR